MFITLSCYRTDFWKPEIGSKNRGHIFYIILSFRHILHLYLLDNWCLPWVPRVPAHIQVGEAVAILRTLLVFVVFLGAFVDAMIHPEHVEQPASGWSVLLGLAARRTERTVAATAAAVAVAAHAHGIIGVLVADAHATRADRGRRSVQQVPLMRQGTSVKEIKCIHTGLFNAPGYFEPPSKSGIVGPILKPFGLVGVISCYFCLVYHEPS